jgi:hypothetical protein
VESNARGERYRVGTETLLAGVGQEPRLGRWGRDAGAKNGVVMHRLDHIVEDDSDDDDEEDSDDDSMDDDDEEDD